MDDPTAREENDKIASLRGLTKQLILQTDAHREDPRTGSVTDAPLNPAAGSLESIIAVIDALAAERCVPRAEIVRRMIETVEGQIALDRAVIALLHRLAQDPTAPAIDRFARRRGGRSP